MIVLICLSIIHLLEAWLEVVVIDLKNASLTSYNRLNKAEHFRSAVLAGSWMLCAIAVVVFLTKEYWMIPALVVNRRNFFDFPLSIFRKRPLDKYEGNDWWVKKFKFLFGGNRVVEFIVTMAITIFCIVKTLL